MANEHPMYLSDGVKCELKTYWEFHESKFTPGDWDASGLFETLDDWYVDAFIVASFTSFYLTPYCFCLQNPLAAVTNFGGTWKDALAKVHVS